MSFWDRLVKSIKKIPFAGLFLGSSPQSYLFSGPKEIILKGYLQNPYVYAGVELVANALASIPLYLVDTKNGNKILKDHPALELVKKPNPYMTWEEFIKNIVTYYYLFGNVFIYKTNVERPRQLYLLRPDRVEIVPDETGQTPVKYYNYVIGGQRIQRGPDLVLHIKAISSGLNLESDYWGLPPLLPASKSIILNNRAKDWNINLIENNARPSGSLVTQERLTEKAREELKRAIEEIYSSPENAGRPLLLEGGLQWQEMSLSPQELDWSKALEISAKEICIVLGVPPELLYEASSRNYASGRVATKNFYYKTVIPLMRYILSKINMDIISTWGDGLELSFDLDNIPALSEDAVEVWDRVIRARLAGIISKNEAREFLDKPAVPEDDFYTPANVLVTDVASQGLINPFTSRRRRRKEEDSEEEEGGEG